MTDKFFISIGIGRLYKVENYYFEEIFLLQKYLQRTFN